ncbi:MAG: pyruvate dehydrogenase complex dihydrolipoamide acetyltransferase [Phycisphaeraceae bacterium]|nr:pyruvate dehydrogenase complex dihydrolipoamide acetyltransferase [Phycisphaeraceae bacterium]
MPIQVTMPRLSDTMEEGTLVKWKVKVGDKVKAGDNLADVETDKATMELQSYDDGTVARLAVAEGQATPVGKLILVLASPGESVEEAAKAGGAGDRAAGKPSDKADQTKAGKTAASAADTASGSSSSGGGAGVAVTATDGGRLRVSPLARKIAEERGVDLTHIAGSGPEGRIIKRDVLAANTASPVPVTKPQAAASTVPAPLIVGKLESKTIAVSNMRKTIARRLVESKATIPHFTVTVTVGMDALLALRTTLNQQLESQQIKLSVNDFVVRGCALALLRHPLINASWSEQGIQQHGSINIGVAVALPQEKGGGLVVPTLRDVQSKGLRSISSETRTLAEKARTKGLTVEEMSDGTFTISNLGMLGVDHFEAIINPPQAAILAVGAAVKRPVVKSTPQGDQLAIGTEMTLTLSADHRVIDGAMAAEYLQTLKGLMENPAALLV